MCISLALAYNLLRFLLVFFSNCILLVFQVKILTRVQGVMCPTCVNIQIETVSTCVSG